MSQRHAWDLRSRETKIKIGKLVIKMVLGDAGKPPTPIPDTPAGRIQLLEDNGLVFQGDVQDVEIHQSTPSHMHLSLPPKEFLEIGHEFVTNPTTSGNYEVPSEYVAFSQRSGTSLTPEDMFFFRIGDYTLSHCK